MHPVAASKGKPKRRILVVDDNIDNVRSMSLLFEVMGHHVDYAINAIVAVDIAARFNPDIVILDLLLPDGHGAQVCRQIRLNPDLAGTKIYGITASKHEKDRQQALAAGCDEVLLKPVSPETFERIIAGR
jgi:CheY-like chemotaxis protein